MINASSASIFTLTQPAGAAAPTEGSASDQTAGIADPGQQPQSETTSSLLGGNSSLIMMVLMVAVFYFLLIRPQQKKAKAHQKMIDSIGKGKEVLTNGGLIGRVTAVSDKTLTLEISEKVRVRVLRSQIAGLYGAETVEKK